MESEEDYKARIEQAIKDYISGKGEYNAPTYVIGQIFSELTHSGMGVQECQQVIEKIRKEIEAGTLFPSISKEEKLKRLNLLENELGKKLWWQGERT